MNIDPKSSMEYWNTETETESQFINVNGFFEVDDTTKYIYISKTLFFQYTYSNVNPI